MKDKTKFVNADDLKIGRLMQFGGSDYAITSLSLNNEQRVIVVAEPMHCFDLNFKKRREAELRLIVPKDTPFVVLK